LHSEHFAKTAIDYHLHWVVEKE
jgi:hypothetical protein